MRRDRRRPAGRRVPAWPLALATIAGCSEELGPERFETTRVAGVVRVGPRPVGSGFVEIMPVDGTRGNVRVAPIGPDGRFAVDGVPVGAVIVGLEQLPIAAVPTATGPVEAWRFRGQRGAIRRTIPAGPGPAEIPIDLIDEAARLRARPAGSPRRRKRSGRPSASAPPPPDPPDVPTPGEPTIRVAYRDGSGRLDLGWPADRIADALADPGGLAWVDILDVGGQTNGRVAAIFRDVFRFHPLAIEDALEETHVPRVDDWVSSIYVVLDSIEVAPDDEAGDGGLRPVEVDFFLGPNYVVSYHNRPVEALERHRRGLDREQETRLRQGSAYLLYRLLDEVVAGYLPAIERLDDRIDAAQAEVFGRPTPATLRAIFEIKRAALELHRVVIPVRELLNRLARDDYPLIPADVRVYFRDAYDNTVRAHAVLESIRDLITGALETYLSVASNRTNEIMKALTLVNVMFLPLTFVVGFFGMNFFGPTLAFESPPLPRAGLFATTLAILVATPVLFFRIARRRGWL